MKHLNLSGIICMLFLLLIQSSCSKDDAFTFQFDENGECYYPSVSPISKASFEKSVVGYGWKYVSTYQIGRDGECMKGEYYADQDGIGPHQYYFENSNTLRYYFYMDARPANGFFTYSYDYTENINKVVTRGSTMLQVISVEGDMLRAVEYMGVYSDGEKIYGLSVYKRMSEKELKDCQQAYPIDFSNEKELILSAPQGPIYIDGKNFSFEILSGNDNYQIKPAKEGICTITVEGNRVNVSLLKNGAFITVSDRSFAKRLWIFSKDASLEPTGTGIYESDFKTLVFNKDGELFLDNGVALNYKTTSFPLKLRDNIPTGSLAEFNPTGAVIMSPEQEVRHMYWDRQGYIHEIIPAEVVKDLIAKADGFSAVYKLELINSYGVVFQVIPITVVYKKDFKAGDKL